MGQEESFDNNELPTAVRCYYENLSSSGAYLLGRPFATSNYFIPLIAAISTSNNSLLMLQIQYFFLLSENGFTMFLWIGAQISSDWLQDVFAVPSLMQLNVDQVGLMFFI